MDELGTFLNFWRGETKPALCGHNSKLPLTTTLLTQFPEFLEFSTLLPIQSEHFSKHIHGEILKPSSEEQCYSIKKERKKEL